MSITAQALLLGRLAPQCIPASFRKHPYWPDHHLLFLFSPRSNLFEYFKDNRNMKNLKDPCACVMG